jgi:hypothetical protein
MSARFASWPAWTLPGPSLAMFVGSLALAFLYVAPAVQLLAPGALADASAPFWRICYRTEKGSSGKGRTTMNQ